MTTKRELKESEAIQLLLKSNVPAKREAFGFSVSHPESDAAGIRFAECGMDNDLSISLSIETDGESGIEWFFRYDFLEMAEFLIRVYAKCGENPTRSEIVENLKLVNATFDEDDLDTKLTLLDDRI